MSDILIIVRSICLAGALFGAVLALVIRKDDNFAPAIIGIIIFVISMIGVYSLGEPYADALNEEIASSTEYKAVHQDEIKSFVNCYKENGYNVCETKDGKEMVVEHYWKKGKTKKKEGNQALKYKGIKDSEIKKYTSCEDDGDSKVCIAKDGTKEKVETYWKIGEKNGNKKD